MSAGTNIPPSANESLSLYQIYQAQRQEIMKHKWIESEKVGHDIGFEQALTDWELRHRAAWLKEHDLAAWHHEHKD
jgi:hypothetical protein